MRGQFIRNLPAHFVSFMPFVHVEPFGTVTLKSGYYRSERVAVVSEAHLDTIGIVSDVDIRNPRILRFF